MIVAITGGTGFIGRRLVMHHVANGDEVRVLSRSPMASGFLKNVAYYRGDLSAPGDLSSFVHGADVLYHCAAELNDESRMAAVHVAGTKTLIAAARGKIGRWVQLSSVGAYGPRRTGLVREMDKPAPAGVYERTKTEADLLVMEAGRRGLDYVIVRPSNVFGADMPNGSLTQMLEMIKKGVFFFIGPEGASANYVHVDNVVAALRLCAIASSASCKTYIVSDWRPLEVLVNAACEMLRCRKPMLRIPEAVAHGLAWCGRAVPGFPLTASRVRALTTRVRYSTERLETDLSFHTLVSVEDGLKELLCCRVH